MSFQKILISSVILLAAGNEYFKAIVTTEPIASWLKFLATDITVPSQRDKLLAAKEMWIQVN